MGLPAALLPFLPAIGQGVMGLGQTIFGALGASKARRAVEKDVNARTPDQGLRYFLQQAMARYTPNAYQSSYYQQMQNQANRGLATALGAAQSRRGGLMSLPGLFQGYTDAQARAAAQAEQIGRQDFAMLGQAARTWAGEKQRVEDMKTNLLMQKWGQKAKLMNQGLQNLYGAGSTASYVATGGASASGGGGIRPGTRSGYQAEDQTYPSY